MGSSLFLKCILVLAIAAFVATQTQTRQRNNGLVRCSKEIGNSRRECLGKYCYKMHTPDDTSKDGIVKKGCMNATDAQTEVGQCTRRPLEEGGSELMCVCRERDFCNSALSRFSFVAFLSVLITSFWV